MVVYFKFVATCRIAGLGGFYLHFGGFQRCVGIIDQLFGNGVLLRPAYYTGRRLSERG